MNRSTSIGSISIKHRWNRAEISLQPEVTATEAEIAAAAGAQYFRITSTDHIWTDPENVDRFIAFYKTLPKDAWLHFHCEAGKGRTTTYMVLYDILRNGMQVPLADIAAREYKIGGVDLLQVNSANAAKKKAPNWKTAFEAERAGMIQLFYQYVRENPDLDATVVGLAAAAPVNEPKN